MKELMTELHNLRKKTNGDTSIIKSIEDEKALFPFSVENRLLPLKFNATEASNESTFSKDNEYKNSGISSNKK